MNQAKKLSYVLFSLLIPLTVYFRLGTALLAGLFSYMILDLTHRRITVRLPKLVKRWISLFIFLVTATGISWLFWFFWKLAMTRTPDIMASLVPRVGELSTRYGLDLPFENLDEFRAAILTGVKENARAITQTSSLLTKGFFQVLVGTMVAILYFMSGDSGPDYKPNLFDELRREFNERIRLFMLSFEKLFGAQILISLINTSLTAIFLLVLNMPYALFLVLSTFIFGAIPIIGNIISNAIIVGTALTVSPRHAAFALVFLVLIHKGEYILNSRIIGSSLKTPMWQTLLGILVGEAVMGLPGVILAPALLHYLRGEMRSIPIPAEAAGTTNLR
ncbi:MAG: AI-2E family transporter [Elusimicrobia bacterium]|nr:AI-2E family transporter [Elusimicrobiota bacterium]